MVNGYYYLKYIDAVRENPTAENLENLGNWFEQFGGRYWNGSAYYIGDNDFLRPVLNPVEFDDDGYPCQWDTVGWEIITL